MVLSVTILKCHIIICMGFINIILLYIKRHTNVGPQILDEYEVSYCCGARTRDDFLFLAIQRVCTREYPFFFTKRYTSTGVRVEGTFLSKPRVLCVGGGSIMMALFGGVFFVFVFEWEGGNALRCIFSEKTNERHTRWRLVRAGMRDRRVSHGGHTTDAH